MSKRMKVKSKEVRKIMIRGRREGRGPKVRSKR